VPPEEREPGARALERAPLLVALAASLAWLALSPPGANDLVGGDEGYYATMARNVLADAAQRVSPSLSPLGPPGDKPPLYPLLLAPWVAALGPVPAAVRIPSAVFALVIAWAIGRLVRLPAGAGGALFATALLATLPWFADASRPAAAELPLTAFASLALVLLAERVSPARAAMAGVLLGLAFLCKLWLVAPAALAAVAMLAGRGPGSRGALLALGAAAAGTASLHLLAVALAAPEALDHWRYIYFGRSLAERVAGAGYADYWHRPVGAYWASLTRAFGLVLPLVAAGVEAAWRRRREPVPRALLVWAAGVLALSAFRVQSGGYAYVVVPAWAGLAALGAHAIARGEGRRPLPLVLGALLTSPLVARWSADGLPLAAWTAVWLAGAGLLALRFAPRLASRVAIAWAVAAIALGTARSAQRLAVPFHTPGYERIASAVSGAVADVPPGRRSVLAPEAPVFSYHLFRTAGYWGTPSNPWDAARLAELRADTGLRVLIVDPSRRFYGGWPDSTTLAWLVAECRELPAADRGGPAGPQALRVFLRGRVRSEPSGP
jgi:4-amino-4-deoxy-L-arabinose transferase-like glycosyltransferase